MSRAQEQKKKKTQRHNTISFHLTMSADGCHPFKNFLKYYHCIISEMVFIFCFLNQLCFQGEEDRIGTGGELQHG